MQSRRQFLATATMLPAVAGCSSPDERDELEESDANGGETTDGPSADGTSTDGTSTESGDSDGSQSESSGQTDTEADDETAEDETGTQPRSYDVFQDVLVPPPIFLDESETDLVTGAAVFETRDELEQLLSADGIIQRNGVDAWLDDTWFEHTNVYFISTAVPDPAYDEIAVTEIAIESDTLHLEIDVSRDESRDANAPPSHIGQAAALLRVTADKPPQSLTVSVDVDWQEYDWFATEDALIDPAVLPGAVAPDRGPVSLPTGDECTAVDAPPQTDPRGVVWGTARGGDGDLSWALRMQPSERDNLTFESGDRVAFELTNISYKSKTLGNSASAGLAVLSEQGWLPVVRTRFLRSTAFLHPPGEGYEWQFELTPEGIADAFALGSGWQTDEADTDDGSEAFEFEGRVCEDMPAGRYRFHYPVGQRQLAVAFDYVG